SGSTANRSTMPSTWSARPMPTGPSSTPSAPTRRWPGTGRHRSTAGWRTRPSPTFPSPKSCQLLDAGHGPPPLLPDTGTDKEPAADPDEEPGPDEDTGTAPSWSRTDTDPTLNRPGFSAATLRGRALG